jgi:hypothetical protein
MSIVGLLCQPNFFQVFLANNGTPMQPKLSVRGYRDRRLYAHFE